MPSFHQNNTITIKEGIGNYCLYNGNLSVAENYEAANWLIQNVFSKIKHHVVIAGLNPPQFLITEITKHKNIELIANPSQQKMDELITNAQIHVLYTKQPTGLKLKLLNVLYAGRFVVCNGNMVSGTNLISDNTLFIADLSGEFINQINTRFGKEFNTILIEERTKQLNVFNNDKNIELLIKEVF